MEPEFLESGEDWSERVMRVNRTAVVATMVLCSSVGAFCFVVGGQSDWQFAVNVGICAAAALAVGAGVTVLVHRGSKERVALFTETNEALAVVGGEDGASRRWG